jgi:uncharacterized DUF497 family protein
MTAPPRKEGHRDDPLVLLRDDKHNPREPRCHALGETGDRRRLHMTFTLRADGTLMRMISARGMHRKAKSIDGQAKQNSA